MIDEQWDAYIKRTYNKTITEVEANGVLYKLKKPLHIEMRRTPETADRYIGEYEAVCPELNYHSRNGWIGQTEIPAAQQLESELKEMLRQRFTIKRNYERLLKLRAEYIDYDSAAYTDYTGARRETEADEPFMRCEKCGEVIGDMMSYWGKGKCPWCGDVLLRK